MTDKELILAEIERLKEYYPSWQLKLAMDDLVSFINSLPEKSVSSDLDFEKELYKQFGQVKDFTLGMRIARYFYGLAKKR